MDIQGMNAGILDPNGINRYNPEDIKRIPQQPSSGVPNPPDLIVQTIHLRNNANINVVRNIEAATLNPYDVPNFPASVTYFIRISTSVTPEDFGSDDALPENPPRIVLIPIRDRYGLLNHWNGERNNVANPGMTLSRFSTPIEEVGAPRMYNEMYIQDPENEDEWDDYSIPIQRQILEDIDAINNGQSINMPPAAPLRRSTRQQRGPAPSIALNECQGKICPITLRPIQNYGIKLSDGQCYDPTALVEWYAHNNNTTPFRAQYTPEDRRKIEEWRDQQGGRTRSRRRHRMNHKKPKTKTKPKSKSKSKSKSKTTTNYKKGLKTKRRLTKHKKGLKSKSKKRG